ncbi:MAG: hypothetical protein HOK82_02680 [Rhodospirillaceae bacterium]|jgi:hypothetical protein|nr:hypothetical protein [Rhodospirillaceae bacterium]
MTRIRTLLVVSFATVLMWIAAPPATAGGNKPFEPIDIEALIRSCDDDPGGTIATVPIAHSFWKEADCLERLALDQADIMFERSWKFRGLSPWQSIKNLRRNYTEFYREIFAGHRNCRAQPIGGCGTMTSILLPEHVAYELEQLVRIMVRQRNAREF